MLSNTVNDSIIPVNKSLAHFATFLIKWVSELLDDNYYKINSDYVDQILLYLYLLYIINTTEIKIVHVLYPKWRESGFFTSL